MFRRLLLVATAFSGIAASQSIPTPESVLGHKPGDDFYLASYDDSRAYFHRLAAASNRIKIINVGKTTRGNDWEIAIISSPQNLANLDANKAISQRLAHGRGLDDAAAHALARQGKAIVHIDGGLHSTEVAGAQQSILLAYKLLSTQGDPEIDAILDNVILMLWPTLNPDGQNEVVSWYRRNLGTPFEVSPLPDLYQEYVGHDNNRDGYMNNMLESRDVTKTELEWDPVIFYCHHQTAPFPTRIFIPPFTEPISSNINPLMARWLNVMGIDMAAYLDEHGMPGAVHRVGFDNWYPAFNNASLFAIDQFHLPVANVLAGLTPDQFYCSGSLLQTELKDIAQPAVAGLPRDPVVMFENGPAFDTRPGFKGAVLATYPKDSNPLASGYLLHPERIQGKVAALEAFYGQGRIFLFGFRPQWRGQSHGTYKFFFNAIYDKAAPPKPVSAEAAPDRWAAVVAPVKSDLGSLLGLNQAFFAARGPAAVEARARLNAALDQFEKERIQEVQDTASGMDETNRKKASDLVKSMRKAAGDLRTKEVEPGVDAGALAERYKIE